MNMAVKKMSNIIPANNFSQLSADFLLAIIPLQGFAPLNMTTKVNCTYQPGIEKCAHGQVKVGTTIDALDYMGCLTASKCGTRLQPKMGAPSDVTRWPVTVTCYLRCLQVNN